jgi:hypothetical protein
MSKNLNKLNELTKTRAELLAQVSATEKAIGLTSGLVAKEFGEVVAVEAKPSSASVLRSVSPEEPKKPAKTATAAKEKAHFEAKEFDVSEADLQSVMKVGVAMSAAEVTEAASKEMLVGDPSDKGVKREVARVLKLLVTSSFVERSGEKRGTKYTLRK